MSKYSQGTYEVKNRDKYIGAGKYGRGADGNPVYKSSWERVMMEFLDGNSNIIKWGYEIMSIPYFNPITRKKSNYWPDFFVQYVDKTGATRIDMLEVKPRSQVTLESARTKKDKLSVVQNTAKWEAAMAFAKMKGIRFRVVDEEQIFHTKPKRISKPRIPRRR